MPVSGKVIKQKWTSARDIWQRSHRKRKEAIQNGETVNDLKDIDRYEKLKFLCKVYDREDYSKTEKSEKIVDSYKGNIERPPSPQGDLDEENIPVHNPEQTESFVHFLLNKKAQQRPAISPSVISKKRKLEHSNDVHEKEDQQTTVVVNVEDMIRVSNLNSASKQRTSSVDGRETQKRNFNPSYTPRCEPIYFNQFEEQLTSPRNNHSTKKTPSQSPQKPVPNSANLVLKSTSQFVKKDNLTLSSFVNLPSSNISNDKITKHHGHQASEEMGHKNKINEIKVEPSSSKISSEDNDTLNTELDQFFQLLKLRIADFSKAEMMDFFFGILKNRIENKNHVMDTFFEILKPLIDKHKSLDFQIEALQLIKKVQEDRTN